MPSTCVILQTLAQRKMYLKNRIQEMVMLIIEIQFLLDSFMIEYLILNVHLNKHFCKCHLPVKAIITLCVCTWGSIWIKEFFKRKLWP